MMARAARGLAPGKKAPADTAVSRKATAAEAARDEQRLLAGAWAAYHQGVAEADEAPMIEPAPARPERLVVQNWKSEPGLIPIGDVHLQLEPGQEVTLWVGRAGAVRLGDDGPAEGLLSILTEDDTLLA